MALAQIYRVVQDLEGNVVTGVLGTVTLSGTSTLASLFADAEGTLPLPNPTTNNAQYGSFALFVGAGTYTMQFVKAGYTFETQYNITMRDPAAGVNTITGTANRVLVTPVPGVGAVTLSTPQDIAPDSSVQFAHIGVGTPATSAPIAYADQPAARTALGLGTLAVQNANAVAITGGTALDLAMVRAAVFSVLNQPGNDQYALFTTMNGSGGTNRWALHCGGDATSYTNGAFLFHTPTSLAGRISLLYERGTEHGIVIKPVNDSGGTSTISFVNSIDTQVGSIQTTGAATSYTTSSDARLKHAIAALTGALDVVAALRPVKFRWNADDSPGVGYLAHELQQVVPDAVSGLPDEVNEDGSVKPQQVDHSKIVPWLTAALQEAVAQIQGLTARVASLEEQLGV